MAGASVAAVAGPATISRPPVATTSTHASGRIRAAPSCETQDAQATSAASPGGVDLRQVVGEPRHPEQGVAQRFDVRRGLAAVPEQQRCRADRVDQVVGVGAGQRGEAGHVVTEHFGGDSAEPEHHNRAEHRFLHDADDGLDAARDHGLDEHSGHPSGELVLEAAHRPAHLVGPVQVQFDCARVGLVEQAGHISLDHHVTA